MIPQCHPSTQISKVEIERIKPYLRGLLDEGYNLRSGNLRLLDGKEASLGSVKAGDSLCILEFRPHGSQEQNGARRIESYAFGTDGKLILATAREWGEKVVKGLRYSGYSEVTPPFARDGVALIREVLGKALQEA